MLAYHVTDGQTSFPLRPNYNETLLTVSVWVANGVPLLSRIIFPILSLYRHNTIMSSESFSRPFLSKRVWSYYGSLALFILETDDPFRRIIRLVVNTSSINTGRTTGRRISQKSRHAGKTLKLREYRSWSFSWKKRKANEEAINSLQCLNNHCGQTTILELHFTERNHCLHVTKPWLLSSSSCSPFIHTDGLSVQTNYPL